MQSGTYMVVTDETFAEEIPSLLLVTKGPVLTFMAVTALGCKEISESEYALLGNRVKGMLEATRSSLLPSARGPSLLGSKSSVFVHSFNKHLLFPVYLALCHVREDGQGVVPAHRNL